ncbi:MAG: helix-hairpin-helix domain-containing protein [Bifidobacterium sp.]|jgi:competence protein ComEA|nr:helix-hairpin-helix domain-containing protein [Bifidobacterium sp.]MCH4175770.1 helix-hairpin-helix domain-containing protein [Bifidobacterium sp.]
MTAPIANRLRALDQTHDDYELKETLLDEAHCEGVQIDEAHRDETLSTSSTEYPQHLKLADLMKSTTSVDGKHIESPVGLQHHAAIMNDVRLGQHTRERKRVYFSLGHAIVVIVLLVAALCASLTLLLQQASNYAAFQRQALSMGNQEVSVSPSMSVHADSSDVQNDNSNAASASPNVAESPETSRSSISSSSTPAAQDNSSDEHLINLNEANDAELMQISGIGPATAEKIIKYRQQQGRFNSIDQLLDIQGIGVKKLELIRPYVTVG